MAHVDVYISVGSNLGDKLANCREGVDALVHSARCTLMGQSPFYRTEPVDYADQDWFVNGVVKVGTDRTAQALLGAMLAVEKAAGRVRGGVRFGPRVLDLDMIFYGDRVIDLPELTVPHPRMHKRRFVLKPICDIDSQFRHPLLNQTVGQLLEGLEATEQQVMRMPCDF